MSGLKRAVVCRTESPSWTPLLEIRAVLRVAKGWLVLSPSVAQFCLRIVQSRSFG